LQIHGADRTVALLLGVARLGEASLLGWWRAHGLDQSGAFVLSGSFPRTWRCAALELDLASAARRHQELLPRPGALHLFSDGLPYRRLAAAWLAERKTTGPSPLIDVLTDWDVSSGTVALAEWADATANGEAKRLGPAMCLGSLAPAAIQQEATLESACCRLAVAYLDMKGSADFVPPYFELSA
jgi:hypothetical protein